MLEKKDKKLFYLVNFLKIVPLENSLNNKDNERQSAMIKYINLNFLTCLNTLSSDLILETLLSFKMN